MIPRSLTSSSGYDLLTLPHTSEPPSRAALLWQGKPPQAKRKPGGRYYPEANSRLDGILRLLPSPEALEEPINYDWQPD